MSMFHLLFRPETQKAHASVVRSGNSLFPDNRAARNPSFPLAMKAAAQHDTRPTATENGNDVGAASASNSGDLFVSHALSGTSRTRPGVASFQTGSSQGSRNDRTQEPSAAPTTAFKEPPTEIPLGEDTGAIFRSDRKSFPLHDETDATETSDTAKIIGVPSESASDSQIVRSAETVAALLSAGSDTVDSAVTPAAAPEWPQPRNTDAEPGPQPAPTPANDANAAVAPRHATDAPLQTDSAAVRPAAASPSPQPALTRFATATERPEPRNTGAEPGPQPAPTPAPANDADAAVAPRHATDAPLQADSAAVRPAAAASPSPQPAPIHFAAAPEWPEPRNTGAETPVAFNAAKPGPVIDETPADRPTARPEADAAPVALPSRVRTSFETPRVRARATGSDATASENESGENGRPLRFASSSATAERDVFSNENDNRQTLAETDGRATMLRARLAASGGQAEGNYFHAAAPGEWNRNVAARALDDAPMSDATAAAAAQRTEHIQSMVARFGDLIAGALTGKGQVMNIRLVPVALGRLSLRCREEQGRLSVEITAETREARAFLTAHESEIRTVVQNSGYRLTHFDVHAQGEDAGRRLFRDREHTGETHDAGRHARHAEQTESAVAPELLGNRAAEPGRLWWVA
jgi:flagellar hook-length control protein FliK